MPKVGIMVEKTNLVEGVKYSLLGFVPSSSCREVKNGSANHRLWWRSLLIDQSEKLKFLTS